MSEHTRDEEQNQFDDDYWGMDDYSINDNLTFSSSEAKKDTRTKDELDKLESDKQKALKLIFQFRENPNQRKIPFTDKTYEVTPKYENVSASQLANELIERVNDPGSHKQKSLKLCGPAAYSVVWSNYDPLGYVDAVIDLYQTGRFIYNDLEIEANPDTFNQEISKDLASVDWMLFSAIRHSENTFGYDPKENSGISAFTTHWEMSSWLENIDNVSEARTSSPSIELINTAFKKGSTIVLLVDWNQLDDMKKKGKGGSKKSKKPDSYINSVLGNHYIIVKSKIIIEDDKAVFTVWTWGKEEEVSIEKSKFNYAVKDSFVVEQTN